MSSHGRLGRPQCGGAQANARHCMAKLECLIGPSPIPVRQATRCPCHQRRRKRRRGRLAIAPVASPPRRHTPKRRRTNAAAESRRQEGASSRGPPPTKSTPAQPLAHPGRGVRRLATPWTGPDIAPEERVGDPTIAPQRAKPVKDWAMAHRLDNNFSNSLRSAPRIRPAERPPRQPNVAEAARPARHRSARHAIASLRGVSGLPRMHRASVTPRRSPAKLRRPPQYKKSRHDKARTVREAGRQQSGRRMQAQKKQRTRM